MKTKRSGQGVGGRLQPFWFAVILNVVCGSGAAFAQSGSQAASPQRSSAELQWLQQRSLIVHTADPLAGAAVVRLAAPVKGPAGGVATIRASLAEQVECAGGIGPRFYRNILSFVPDEPCVKDRSGAELICGLLRQLQPGVVPIHV